MYTTIDTPHRFSLHSESSKKSDSDAESRKSSLVPPNTVKNNYLRKSGLDKKPPVRQSIACSTSSINKNVKDILKNPKTKGRKDLTSNKTSVITSKKYMSSNTLNNQKKPSVMLDKCTMTSPKMDNTESKYKFLSSPGEFDRPSVIINPSAKNLTTSSINTNHVCSNVQNFNFCQHSCADDAKKSTDLDVNHVSVEQKSNEMSSFDKNGLLMLKNFVQQSLQVCENQVLQFKKTIECIDGLLKEQSNTSDKQDVVKNFGSDESNLTHTPSFDANSSTLMDNKSFGTDQSTKLDTSSSKKNNLLPYQVKRLMLNNSDLHESTSMESLNCNKRLSTIGEASYETSSENSATKKDQLAHQEQKYPEIKEEPDESLEDKENKFSPIPKTTRRKTISDFKSPLRRSDRIAAKSMLELSDSNKQDSFTLLENELNLVYKPTSPKSLPVSPRKIPLSPSTIKKWGKQAEPLKEYMALKVNGTFLITPDVKKFQSRIENDTPSNRKSLSRKIFMELCDLYAESPE